MHLGNTPPLRFASSHSLLPIVLISWRRLPPTFPSKRTMPKKILLSGAKGRMGQAIQSIAHNQLPYISPHRSRDDPSPHWAMRCGHRFFIATPPYPWRIWQQIMGNPWLLNHWTCKRGKGKDHSFIRENTHGLGGEFFHRGEPAFLSYPKSG